MTPTVSIIVPVYNVEKYLPACLDSLINQTLQDIEIICVNDCSPDGSDTVLQQYAEKDDRIKIVNHEYNQGLGAARNTGVRVASANYIGFVDSDDYVATDMFELLYNAIQDNQVQMAMCGISKVSDDGLVETAGEYLKKGNLSVLDVLKNASLYEALLPAWNKLYIKDLIKDIKQLPIVSEDQPFIGELFSKIDAVSIVPKPCYYYRNREGTLSKPKEHTPKNWDDFFDSHRLFFKALSKRFHTADLRIQIVLRHFSLLWNIDKFNLLAASNWPIQQQAIRTHIKSDSLSLKQVNILMYGFLLLLISEKFPHSRRKFLLKISLKFSRTAWLHKYCILSFPVDLFKLIWPTIKFKLKILLDAIEQGFIRFLALVYRLKYRKKLWLVGERVDTAQENGFYFFNYLLTHQTQEQAYYVVDRKAVLPQVLQNHSQIILFNSLKHKLLFTLTSFYVNSHYNTCYPRTLFGKRLYPISKQTKNIFLQHGITLSDVSPYYGKQASDIDLFVCGAQPEYDFVRSCFGYEDKELALTGFARFDGLHDMCVKRQILFMPSWRRTLWSNNPNDDITLFSNTAYYRELQRLLNNVELIALLEQYDYQLLFYPHYEIQKFLHLFTKTSERIVLINKEACTVQQLLKDSAVLITDSSSVSFDFGYMYKPVIYYHFQEEINCKEELSLSYFQDRESGFGDVVESEDELLEKLRHLMDKNCVMEMRYRERVQQFYPLYDTHNCERIYHRIIKNQ